MSVAHNAICFINSYYLPMHYRPSIPHFVLAIPLTIANFSYLCFFLVSCFTWGQISFFLTYWLWIFLNGQPLFFEQSMFVVLNPHRMPLIILHHPHCIHLPSFFIHHFPYTMLHCFTTNLGCYTLRLSVYSLHLNALFVFQWYSKSSLHGGTCCQV